MPIGDPWRAAVGLLRTPPAAVPSPRLPRPTQSSLSACRVSSPCRSFFNFQYYFLMRKKFHWWEFLLFAIQHWTFYEHAYIGIYPRLMHFLHIESTMVFLCDRRYQNSLYLKDTVVCLITLINHCSFLRRSTRGNRGPIHRRRGRGCSWSWGQKSPPFRRSSNFKKGQCIFNCYSIMSKISILKTVGKHNTVSTFK